MLLQVDSVTSQDSRDRYVCIYLQLKAGMFFIGGQSQQVLKVGVLIDQVRFPKQYAFLPVLTIFSFLRLLLRTRETLAVIPYWPNNRFPVLLQTQLSEPSLEDGIFCCTVQYSALLYLSSSHLLFYFLLISILQEDVHLSL